MFPENIKPKFDHYSVKTTDLLVSLTLELKYHQIKLEEVFRDENLYIEEINVILGQIVSRGSDAIAIWCFIQLKQLNG